MFVLDTDHVTLYQQGHQSLTRHINALAPNLVAVTIVTFEEQLSGRLAVAHRAQKISERIQAYYWLRRTQSFFCQTPIIPFDESAAAEYQQLSGLRLRVGTRDQLIASIAIANKAILLSRNLRDFQRIPGLQVEDWSV